MAPTMPITIANTATTTTALATYVFFVVIDFALRSMRRTMATLKMR